MGLIQRIRERAREIARIPPGVLFRGIEDQLVRRSVAEIRAAVARHGSADRLAGKMLRMAQAQNESMVSTVLLAAFGLHWTLKLLKALRDKKSLLFSIVDMPGPEDGPPRKAIGHLFMWITLLFYGVLYMQSNLEMHTMVFRDQSGKMCKIDTRWSGVHDYVLHSYSWDSDGRGYVAVWRGGDRYDIMSGDRKVMTMTGSFFDGWVIRDLDGRPKYTNVEIEDDSREVITMPWMPPLDGSRTSESAGKNAHIQRWDYFRG